MSRRPRSTRCRATFCWDESGGVLQLEQHLACRSLVGHVAGLMWGAHRLRQALAVIDAPRERGRSASRSQTELNGEA